MALLGLHISFPSPVREAQAPAVPPPLGLECRLLWRCGPLRMSRSCFFPGVTQHLKGRGMHCAPGLPALALSTAQALSCFVYSFVYGIANFLVSGLGTSILSTAA